MSRYNRYHPAALKLLALAQERVRLESRDVCTVADLVDGCILSNDPLFCEVFSRNNLIINSPKLEDIRQNVSAQRANKTVSDATSGKIHLEDDLRKVLDAAEALVVASEKIEYAHLLATIWRLFPGLLQSFTENEILVEQLVLPPWPEAPTAVTAPQRPRQAERQPASAVAVSSNPPALKSGGLLEQLGKDLTAREPKHPVVGREREIEDVIHALLKFFKPNPLLLGEAGVGKTAIVEGLAQRIRSGNVPEALRDCRIIEIRLSDLIAGTSFHGSYEERLKKLIDELESSPQLILFLDEIHQLVPETRERNASEALKPALARGSIRCIGATTLADYYRSFQKDSALSRRFHEIRVAEPSPQDTLTILEQAAPSLEKHFNLSIPYKSLGLAVRLGQKFLTHRRFPDKAFDLLDQACALAAGQMLSTVGNEHINLVAARLSGNRLAEDGVNLEKTLASLEKDLGERVIGQPEAIRAVANTLRLTKKQLDLRPERPDGVFLFIGPTGVGKTALAVAMAEVFGGGEEHLLRLDMGEFSEQHSVARLIGAPAGYVGYDDEPQLLKYLRKNPSGILLLDEFEKAHPKVHQCFLQVFDTGRLTDARGDTYSLTNTTIIATANPAPQVNAPIRGFVGNNEVMVNEVDPYPLKTLETLFPLELLGRFDEIIRFQPLNQDLAREILEHGILRKANGNLLAQHDIELDVGDHLKEKIVSQGFIYTLGVRQLQRAFEDLVMREISNSLENLLQDRQDSQPLKVYADWIGDQVVLEVQQR